VSSKSRPNALQVLFNAANVAIGVGTCFFVGRVWLAAELARHLPAVLAAVACVYFVTNTVLVSGILSLLQGKPLAEVCVSGMHGRFRISWLASRWWDWFQSPGGLYPEMHGSSCCRWSI
jgi:hypothetical protein